MKSDLINLSQLPIETLAEMANEKAELVEKNARKTVSDAIDCGRYLTAIKAQIEHGKWAAWLGANWNYSQSLANRYMLLSNSERAPNLKDATSIREALRMIGDDREQKEALARTDRIPDRVEVSIPDDSTRVLDDDGDPDTDQVDDDPTPDPPTIRKTATGTQKVSEDKKPKTQPIVPEIVEEPEPSDPIQEWIETHTLADLVTLVIAKTCSEDDAAARKKAAKQLRQMADKLDPPTKFFKPDLDEVTTYMGTLGDAIGKDITRESESFFDFYESKGWLVGKVSMKDWRASARKWLREHEANPFGGDSSGRAKNGHASGYKPVEERFKPASEIFGKHRRAAE